MKQKVNTAKFSEIVEKVKDWSNIDDLVLLCDKADFWTESFLDTAVVASKKQIIRRQIKQLKDESGFPLFASIEKKNELGEPQRIYKHEKKFTVKDYAAVIRYHKDCRIHHHEMEANYHKRAVDRFGQLFLDFEGAEEKYQEQKRKLA